MTSKGIFSITAQEILDSRGNPTVYCKVSTQDGVTGWSAVPSGASTGKYEALELRDKDPFRYNGLGVQHAVYTINNTIHHALHNRSIVDQKEIDRLLIELDATENKQRLGANSMLAVSLATARCAAAYVQKPLYLYLRSLYWSKETDWLMPIPLLNVVNGGKHAAGSVDMQEFMIVPHGATTFNDALRWGAEIYHTLKSVLKSRKYYVGVGDEGGYMSTFSSHRMVLDLLVEAIRKAGYKPGEHVSIALDPAASEFYEEGRYYLSTEKEYVSSEDMIALFTAWTAHYPIISIEDGLAEDDWTGFSQLTKQLGNRVQIVGDDLFVTNINRIQKGIQEHAATAVLIKPNQIGTLTETADAIVLAQNNGLNTVVSHRSGETEDSFIADLSVASNSGQIKSGAPARTERLVKYNRLLIIEKELADQSKFASFPHSTS
jgi:enolase